MATDKITPLVTELRLEQLAAGEPSTLDRADPAIAARLDELQTSTDEILRAYPPAQMRAQIERRARPKRGALLVLSTAGVLGLGLLVLGVVPSLQTANTERTKGGLAPRIVAWKKAWKNANAPQPLADDAIVTRGDLLQLGYIGAGASFGVIVSLDGRGQTTLHFPLSIGGPTRLSRDHGTVLLENAYELDDAPGFERFFFFTADDPLEVAAVIESVRRLADGRDGGRTGLPSLAGKTRVGTLLLQKDAR